MISPVWDDMLAAGGVAADYHGRPLIRHFGDPAGEYAAATQAIAVFDRSHRARLSVTGRAPWQMLNGVLTGYAPGGPDRRSAEVLAGEATYHAVLTPKGKMISDLWAIMRGDEDGEDVLLDVPVAGVTALKENFTKYLPPRFATVSDVSDTTAMITASGPDAAAALSKHALGLRVDADELSSLAEGHWRATGPDVRAALVVMRTAEIWPEAFSVLGSADAVAALWRRLVQDGAQPAGLGVWSTLRVEAGRPVYGTDMDDGTIPIEAGIHDRAIDYHKGCYTGQEVIVRIRDRGHVNKHLRQLRLGDVPAPARGTELLAADGSGKAVGHVTSAVDSPKFGETVALGYVRRGVEAALLDGREVQVPAD